MTTARQLYSLQEVDLDLDRLDSQRAEAEQDLDRIPAFESMESGLREEEQRRDEFQSQQKVRQLDVETLRERSAHLEGQLYGGAVANPRDLESLGQEASNVREQLEKQDADLLELSIQAEESREKCSSLQQRLSDTRSSWETRQAELKERLAGLAVEQEATSAKRVALAADMEPDALQRYDGLRRAKGGLAVAKVERGLCQACRMSLPTTQRQQVRNGRQIVQCSTCGRMLFLS